MSELGQGARALLDAARGGEAPTPAQAEHLWARVRHAIATPPPLAAGGIGGGAIAAAGAGAVVAIAVAAFVATRAPAPVVTAPPEPVASVVAEPPAPPPPIVSAPPAPAARAPRKANPKPLDDVQLVRAAYQARRAGDATRSLALLDEHARRFPGSALAEERDATRVLALCDLGRSTDARAAFDRYARAYPDGVQLKGLPSSCAP